MKYQMGVTRRFFHVKCNKTQNIGVAIATVVRSFIRPISNSKTVALSNLYNS